MAAEKVRMSGRRRQAAMKPSELAASAVSLLQVLSTSCTLSRTREWKDVSLYRSGINNRISGITRKAWSFATPQLGDPALAELLLHF
jgi:hypothetical protein